MTSNSRSLDRAIAAWSQLSEEQKYALARSVARRRVREWKCVLDGVVSVGAGFRTTGGTNEPTDEICLRFAVVCKKKRVSEGRVPEHVAAYLENEEGRRRCAIPTDVDVIAPGEANTNTGLRRGVVVRKDGTPRGDIGAVCAIVEDVDSPGAWYLLSCNHVLALPGIGCDPTLDTDVFRASGPERHAAQKIADLLFHKSLNPGSGYGMDAALAVVSRKDLISPTVQGKRPTKVAGSGVMPHDYMIYTPRNPLPAQFVGEQFDVTVPFRCGASVRHEHVIMSRANTVRGDSGSPLIGSDGTLFGMHYYLTASDSSNPSYALAIPAHSLFRDGTWPIKIKLAT